MTVASAAESRIAATSAIANAPAAAHDAGSCIPKQAQATTSIGAPRRSAGAIRDARFLAYHRP
jgi:hypothetical protein